MPGRPAPSTSVASKRWRPAPTGRENVAIPPAGKTACVPSTTTWPRASGTESSLTQAPVAPVPLASARKQPRPVRRTSTPASWLTFPQLSSARARMRKRSSGADPQVGKTQTAL